MKNCDRNANPSPLMVRGRSRWESRFPVRVLRFTGSHSRKITSLLLKFEPFEGQFGFFCTNPALFSLSLSLSLSIYIYIYISAVLSYLFLFCVFYAISPLFLYNLSFAIPVIPLSHFWGRPLRASIRD